MASPMGQWRHHNPVRIEFGPGAIGRIGAAIADRRYALVSHPDSVPFDGLAARLAEQAGAPVLAIRDVAPNPDIALLREQAAVWAQSDPAPELIVAVGGGSVMDTAKVLAAARGGFEPLLAGLRAGSIRLDDATPILAVPTTAGTGSEVTPWATVWDRAAQRKYSLSDPRLFPECAVIDPEATLGAPAGLTLASGLDALSHALESLWNVNANPVSAALAVPAARAILEALPRALAAPDEPAHRISLSGAALSAGLAFSNTRTALAHSLSYAFTLKRDLAHGIACSFSLPLVMRGALGVSPACDAALAAIFGSATPAAADRLAAFLHDLGVSTRAEDHGIAGEAWRELLAAAFAGERGRNYIGRRDVVLASG